MFVDKINQLVVSIDKDDNIIGVISDTTLPEKIEKEQKKNWIQAIRSYKN